MSARFQFLRQLGFSLVELIAAIVILGIVASMGAVLIRDGMLGYLRGREITSADWQGRLALERITRELRDAVTIAPGSCDNSAPAYSFAYSDINALPISYSYTQSTRTLLRNGQPLADNVIGLRFYCLTSTVQPTATLSDVYYISLSMDVATTNTSATYRDTIRPRNF